VKPEDFRHELERVFVLGKLLKNGYPESFYTGIVGASACMNGRCNLDRGIVVDGATNTITFHLSAPDPEFLYKLAAPWADAVPSHTPFRSLGLSPPPATGPYMTASITPAPRRSVNQSHPLAFRDWTLVRNPRFHEWSADAQPQGYPNKIVLRQGLASAKSNGGRREGSPDVFLPAPVSRISYLAAHDTLQFHTDPLGSTFAFVMNTRIKPFDKRTVRRALNYAINRRVIVGLAGGELAAQPTCQILAPDLPGYRPYCPYTADPSPVGGGTRQTSRRPKH
jgi:peptide/nickel transport system substrate-binding protein